MVTSLTYVSGAIASVQTFIFTFTFTLSAFLSIRTNTERISMKFLESTYYHTPTDELIAFWVKLWYGQGSTIQQKIRIDVKPVLQRYIGNDFYSRYGTLGPQGWRVHYTHAAAEASYNRAWSLVLLFIARRACIARTIRCRRKMSVRLSVCHTPVFYQNG